MTTSTAAEEVIIEEEIELDQCECYGGDFPADEVISVFDRDYWHGDVMRGLCEACRIEFHEHDRQLGFRECSKKY
jgi:hypothetical protein